MAMGLLLLSPETSPNWEQKEWNVSNSAVELHNVGRWRGTFPDLAVELLQVGSGAPPNRQWRKWSFPDVAVEVHKVGRGPFPKLVMGLKWNESIMG